jgi:hypothetical protein
MLTWKHTLLFSYRHFGAPVTYSFTFVLKKGAVHFSETLVTTYYPVWCHNSRDHSLHFQCLENDMFHIKVNVVASKDCANSVLVKHYIHTGVQFFIFSKHWQTDVCLNYIWSFILYLTDNIIHVESIKTNCLMLTREIICLQTEMRSVGKR